MNTFLIPANGYRWAIPTLEGEFNSRLDFDCIITSENLLNVWEQMATGVLKAPGPDGNRYQDLTKTEFGKVARELKRQIRDGNWRPGSTRSVSWQKPDGRGTREIAIRNMSDQVVSKAVSRPIISALEAILPPSCFAYRPGKSSLHLLAQLRYLIETTGHTVVAEQDIRNAFGSVDIERVVLNFSRQLLPNESDRELLNLIETILKGNMQSLVGIEQGDSLSPPTLNLRLYCCLDLPSSQTTSHDRITQKARFSDNVIYLAESVHDGQRALEEDRQVLRDTEFSFKESGRYPVDLRRRGSSIEILGLKLRLEGDQVMFDLGRYAIRNLSKALANARNQSNSVFAAKQILVGWINEYGAVFECYGPWRYLPIIKEVIRDCGLHEYHSDTWLLERMGEAIRIWDTVCVDALDGWSATNDIAS